MELDRENRYRPALQTDRPCFETVVRDPWDNLPDVEELNAQAFLRIRARLESVQRDHKTRAVLVLGEAGTGKTHLLMRVARLLGGNNHILFVPCPTDEDTINQHVWANVIESLTKARPGGLSGRPQLEDMLAHVFAEVLKPLFRQKVESQKAENYARWLKKLEDDPYNLFSLVREGASAQASKNMEILRNLTITHLRARTDGKPDEAITKALMNWCFYQDERLRKTVLAWLSGQPIDQSIADRLGLEQAWVPETEESSISYGKRRERYAFEALKSLGILSTYYRPLVLAFDQLESLRGQRELTEKWGDLVRETHDRVRNCLIVTCIFPSLWDEWFVPTLQSASGQGAIDRITGDRQQLRPLDAQGGEKILASLLADVRQRHRLPTAIYPFTREDAQRMCAGNGASRSPRGFIQAAQQELDDWIDNLQQGPESLGPPPNGRPELTRVDVNALVRERFEKFEAEERARAQGATANEQFLLGTLKQLFRFLAEAARPGHTAKMSRLAHPNNQVMPENFSIALVGHALHLAVLNQQPGASFNARLRNFGYTINARHLPGCRIAVRDANCKALARGGQDEVSLFRGDGGHFILLEVDGLAALNALFRLVVLVDEKGLDCDGEVIDRPRLLEALRGCDLLQGVPVLEEARQVPWVAEALDGAPEDGPEAA